MYDVSIKTIIAITLFACGYMFFIIRKTARGQLDLYDLIMLSAVAIIPSAFALFPKVGVFLATSTGVLFPFVVLFGILLVILFIFIHRLTVKIHRLESDSRLLLQELSLLKQTVDNKQSRIAPAVSAQ
ncbi:MAG: DUF2304 family protein [Candidatus Omnitrophota bacterium]